MYAIRNKKTKKFVTGTDHTGGFMGSDSCWVHYQFTNSERALMYGDAESAEVNMRCRHCGKSYEVVEVKLYLKADADKLEALAKTARENKE